MCCNTSKKPYVTSDSALLGIKTKYASPCAKKKLRNGRETRRQRYELTRTARAIYAKAGEKAGLQYVLDYHRTAKCAYLHYGEVSVKQSVNYNSCFYTGLVACGSIWTCPVCGAKIQERRREEIALGITYINDVMQKQAAMITLTFSHKKYHNLKDILKAQQAAFRKLRSGNAWNKFKDVFGFGGLIRSLENTFSEDNGFHPHTHELWAIDHFTNVDSERLESYLRAKYKAKKHRAKLARLLEMTKPQIFKELLLERWETCCEKVGLMEGVNRSDFRRHSIDIKWNAKCSEYLAKLDDKNLWGADAELARSSTKKGRKSGMHPFEFLTKFNESGDGIWAKRWLEYTHAMKGKRQIYWSHGLKDLIGIKEYTDEQITALQLDEALTVYNLENDEWKKVRSTNPALLLDKCEDTKSKVEISNFIQDLPDKLEIYIRKPRKFNEGKTPALELQTKLNAGLLASSAFALQGSFSPDYIPPLISQVPIEISQENRPKYGCKNQLAQGVNQISLFPD